jgi:hypothetical protein
MKSRRKKKVNVSTVGIRLSNLLSAEHVKEISGTIIVEKHNDDFDSSLMSEYGRLINDYPEISIWKRHDSKWIDFRSISTCTENCSLCEFSDINLFGKFRPNKYCILAYKHCLLPSIPFINPMIDLVQEDPS